MVCVHRSSDDSGFHRESQEEVQVKTEQGNEMSSKNHTTTLLKDIVHKLEDRAIGARTVTYDGFQEALRV
ncbi:hypothetical protein PHMEG_00039861 [Phytophthora megakarya]|uniref:Uncharacterized protein n=1 Tax=Phytophthora megakarya TaxID=4795 RepID=A0A225UEP0_9STRA|nr:hypothetical protein PHMEG_00039861 [Phytophthora megakarya]